MELGGGVILMPSRAPNGKVVFFCTLGDVKGNEIPVSGGVEGDQN